MDKQELREMIGEIKKAYARGDFDRVLMFADEMNIRKLSDSRTLEMIADAHAARGELEEAREVLLMAYEKTPMGRKMAYKLSELSIALDDLDNAVEFYEDFCKMAPHDNDRYLLKYKIGKAGGVSTEDLVKVLAVYCSKEVDEKWMYELATLYYKLRDKEKCLEICDNIILWFANGDYVQKAKSLKTRFGAEAEMINVPEKDGNGAGQLGGDIPLEGFIDMSGQEEAAKDPERFYEQGLSIPRGDRPVVPVTDTSMEEITDAFLEEALQEKTPDQDMPIGEAMAIAEAKEQAEMVEAFERVTKTEVPLDRPSAGRKYGRFEGTVTYETVPEKTQEGTPYEVNGEVITLPKTTFEDMSHDWTIPEELLNAEETTLPPEEFEEPVYGSHRYVPPTEQPKPTYEEPVFGAHRVVTKAEEEAAKAAELQAQLEAAQLKAEEEAARAAALQAQLEAAKEAIKLEEAKEEAAKEAEAPEEAETTEATLTEAAPAAAPVAREVASAYEENIPAAFEQTEEDHPEQMEGELQVSDNPAIAAVIEPMAEPVAEVERAREGFDASFPQSMDDQPEQPVYSEEAGAGYGERTEEATPVYRNEEDGSVPILFAISPREDEGAPDELVLPESVQAEVENARIAERKAPETKEPEKKPQFSSRLQTPVTPEPIPQPQAAPGAEPVATEVIRPTKSSKYSSVSSLFAEDEADNIDGQITLDSMFATYSKREAVPEEIVPEYPEEMSEKIPAAEPVPAVVAVEEEFPVDESTIAVDENEPPLITELGGDFSRRPGTIYETPRFREPVFQEPTYQEAAEISAEPEQAGGDLSDFEKAMQAFDEARAEGKEGFDFKSLFAKASEEDFPDEESEESAYEEYEEQLFDEEPEDFDEDTEEFDEEPEDFDEDEEFDEESEEYDEEYDEEEYEEDYDEESDEEDDSDNADLEDDYEVGFGEEDETGEEWDEDSVEDDEEEYEDETEDGFDQEYDDYEDGEFDEEYVEEDEESFEETYEDDEFAEEYVEEPFEEEEYTEEEYVEDGYEEFDDSYEEGEEEFDDSYEEGEYEDDEYVEEYEEEPYEEEPYEEEYEEVPEGEEAEEYSDEEEAYEEDEYEEDEYEGDEYEDDYDDSYDDGYAEGYGDGTYVMPNSLKEELSEFLLIDGMEERINRTIGSLIEKKRAGDPTGGNLIVTGDTKSGKTYLTIAVIKAVGQEIGGNSRVAKVKADALNGKNMMKVFEKIAGSDLLIENVGYLNDETVDSLIDILSERNLSSMVALEGNQLAIDNMISKHPELNELFQTRLNVAELNLTQWADLACQYAEEQGYTVNDMALLALHAKIDELNVPTERLGYENIRGIIDNAIANASKRGGGKFRFGSKKNKGNAKQLEEADFM